MNSCSPIARQLGEIESIFRQKHFLARHSPAILASKGAKDLEVWYNTEYCKKKNISPETVAEVIKAALKNKSK